MTKPSIQEVETYLIEKKEYTPEHAKDFADRFWNYYESVGWTVGAKKKMQSWTAAIRTWELKHKANGTHQQSFGSSKQPGTSSARIEVARKW